MYFDILPISYLMDIRVASFLNSYLQSNNLISCMFFSRAQASLDNIYKKNGDSVSSVGSLRYCIYKSFSDNVSKMTAC